MSTVSLSFDDEDWAETTTKYWYRGQAYVKVHSTNNSDITKLKRRGWEPMEGEEAEVALPYLIFILPRTNSNEN